jgi:transcriptional regulator with XRE-family HTH domain
VTKHIKRTPPSPLGAEVLRLRRLRGLTQAELSDLAGLKGRSSVAKIETGGTETLLVETLHLLEPALEVPVAHLYRLAGPRVLLRDNVSESVSNYLLCPWVPSDKPTEADKAELLEAMPWFLAAGAPPCDPDIVHEILGLLRRLAAKRRGKPRR